MPVPTTETPRRWSSRLLWASAAAAFLAFAAWQGTLSRSTIDAHWGVLATIGCALGAAAVAGRQLQHKSSRVWARDGLGTLVGDLTRRTRRPAPLLAGVTAWTVLILVTIGWDLYSFSREVLDLPTLSRLIGDVTGHDWGRALLFAGWLVLGVYLTFGWQDRRTEGTS